MLKEKKLLKELLKLTNDEDSNIVRYHYNLLFIFNNLKVMHSCDGKTHSNILIAAQEALFCFSLSMLKTGMPPENHDTLLLILQQ